jgi:hypothetical protein
MSNLKVFRVLLTETLGFSVDVEAADITDAVMLVRENIDELSPIEDSTLYPGYQVEDATEIDPADAFVQTVPCVPR